MNRVAPGVINVVTGLARSSDGVNENPTFRNRFHRFDADRKTGRQNSLDTMKRLTLELGAIANVILDDADLSTAIPMAIKPLPE